MTPDDILFFTDAIDSLTRSNERTDDDGNVASEAIHAAISACARAITIAIEDALVADTFDETFPGSDFVEKCDDRGSRKCGDGSSCTRRRKVSSDHPEKSW